MNPINLDFKLNADPKSVALLAAGVFISSRAGALLALRKTRSGRSSDEFFGRGTRYRAPRQSIIRDAVSAFIEKKLEQEMPRYSAGVTHGRRYQPPTIINNYYNGSEESEADVETTENDITDDSDE